MTVTTTGIIVTHIGNGATTTFPYAFKVISADDLIVRTYDTTTQLLTTLSSSLYSVTGIGSETGGDVTYPLAGSPLSSTQRLIIERNLEFTQELDINNQDGFNPEAVESELDRIVMMIQQLGGEGGLLQRAFTVPVGDLITDLELPIDAERANKYFAFDSNGAPVVIGTAPSPQYQGAFASADEPTTRLDGSALQVGDLYFNTDTQTLMVWNGATWVAAAVTGSLATAADITVVDVGAFYTGTDVEAVLQEIPCLFVYRAGDTMTGTLTAPDILVTNDFDVDGVATVGETALFNGPLRTGVAALTSSVAITLTMTAESKKTITLDHNTTITVQDEAANQMVEVWITQGSTGGTAAWSGVDNWIGGSAPTLSTTTGEIDIIILSSASDGSTITGHHLGTAS